MQYLATCAVLITLLIFISARSPPPLSKPSASNNRLCPEEYYRELHSREDETISELNDNDDDDDVDETLESICEQAMTMVVRHRNFPNLNPTVLLGYCPHYGERLALARQNKTLCENKKQETQELEKKRYYDEDGDRRHALRRKELKKRFALRFIRKRMSKN